MDGKFLPTFSIDLRFHFANAIVFTAGTILLQDKRLGCTTVGSLLDWASKLPKDAGFRKEHAALEMTPNANT